MSDDSGNSEFDLARAEAVSENLFVYHGRYSDYCVDLSRRLCSCPAFVFRQKECKHIRGLMENMSIDLSKVDKAVEVFPSSLKPLNDVFGGGLYSTDGTVGIYGLPDMGKSLFAVQEMFFLSSQGVNTLYVGTEGGELTMINQWMPVFKARFKGKNEGKMFFESRKTLDSLMDYLGFKIAVTFQTARKKKGEETGRMKFTVLGKTEAEIEKDVREKKIKFLAVDSLSSPLRQAIPDDRENNAAKASALSLILGKLNQIQEKYGIAVLVTSHAVRDPTDQYAGVKTTAARGGVAFAHYCKRLLYLDARSAAQYRDYRRFWVVGAENVPKFSVVIGAKISDIGFDVSDIDVENLLTDSEKKLKAGAEAGEEEEG